MIPFKAYLILGAFLFCAGLFIILTKKNTILILIGVELIFNAANINFVAFGQFHQSIHGQLFVLFIIMIAVCEAAVGLAIVLNVYSYFKQVNPDHLNELKDK